MVEVVGHGAVSIVWGAVPRQPEQAIRLVRPD
jgi:hypothetical protein